MSNKIFSYNNYNNINESDENISESELKIILINKIDKLKDRIWNSNLDVSLSDYLDTLEDESYSLEECFHVLCLSLKDISKIEYQGYNGGNLLLKNKNIFIEYINLYPFDIVSSFKKVLHRFGLS